MSQIGHLAHSIEYYSKYSKHQPHEEDTIIPLYLHAQLVCVNENENTDFKKSVRRSLLPSIISR